MPTLLILHKLAAGCLSIATNLVLQVLLTLTVHICLRTLIYRYLSVYQLQATTVLIMLKCTEMWTITTANKKQTEARDMDMEKNVQNQ